MAPQAEKYEAETPPVLALCPLPAIASLAPTSAVHATEFDLTQQHASGPVPLPKLNNIVSTANLGCKLDLKRIAIYGSNTEYAPWRFNALVMRIREPQATAKIFASGKIVCTGARSVEESKLAVRKFARSIVKLGYEVRLSGFKVENLVGGCDFGFPICLEDFAYSEAVSATYEPELFPGLKYTCSLKSGDSVSMTIFASGKVTIMGAKSHDQMHEALEAISPVLTRFRRSNGARLGAHGAQ